VLSKQLRFKRIIADASALQHRLDDDLKLGDDLGII
jgi:hypothetical protein